MEPTVSGHRLVVEAGPGVIRRMCCGTTLSADAKMDAMGGAALAAIDDPVALVDGRPAAIGSLWCATLRSLDCGGAQGVIVVHPSWWSASRVHVVRAAAETLAGEVEVRPRSWLLTQAVSESASQATVVEIAERLVAVAGAQTSSAPAVSAVPRTAEPLLVAEEVAGLIAASGAAVLIDVPGAIAGARELATLIADEALLLGRRVEVIDDAQLHQLAGAVKSLPTPAPTPALAAPDPASGEGARSRGRAPARLAVAGVVLAAVAPALADRAELGRHATPAADPSPTTFLVEGRVALTVPAGWPTRRVIAGPGSARVLLTSPSDPEVALHVTQSPVAGETLVGTAGRLKRAMDAEPAGVFVDFNPSGLSAGRAAVTYREVRTGHEVRWTVLLDGTVRISVGCQSRPGGEDAVREVCQQAVRSAHAVG
jgi:type VII secretion-associated protein (TIGR03931 family)